MTTTTPTSSRDQATELTARPEPTEIQGRDGVGAGPGAMEEDDTLRTLAPRSVHRQFGPDTSGIEPEPNQQEGVREWIDRSPGMQTSFPEQGR